jgi:hypothetical protein
MASKNCGMCFGRRTVKCSRCCTLGNYLTVSGEQVTCTCSGGYVECPACDGTGRQRVTSASAASLYENTTDDRKTSEESPEALISSMHELRKDIRRGINQCSLLPPALRDDWQERLANLTDANCVAELEALRREVKDAYEKRTLFFDYRQVSKSTDLESDLSLLETELRSLRDQCSRYLSKLH